MGYDPLICYNSIVAQGKGPCPNALGTASSYHCLDAQETGPLHEFCYKENIYYSPFNYSEAYNPSLCAPNEYNAVKCQEAVFATVNELVKYLVKNPQLDSRECECCCSCLAYGTPIAIPTGLKAIEKIAVGEEVMGGSMTITSGNLAFTWQPSTVSFSQGTPPSEPESGIASTMVFIYCRYDLGIISTEDQLFMTPSGIMKQANTLKPGDQLVLVDGSAVQIQSIKLGNWSGGVHHISINKPYTGDINGHLLSAGSFVIGDFSIQMDPQALGDKFEAGPMIGSKEYDEINSTTLIRAGVYTHKTALKASASVPLHKHFKLFSEESSYIPSDASSFITNRQAIDIVGNPDAHFRPYGNKSGIDSLKYLFKLYKTFYPDYTFYLDWENITPNAYAFISYGVKTVVISGGLIRLNGLYIEGQAFIIAHCIARLADLSIYSGPHPLPTIMADYYGMGLMMPTVWDFNAFAVDGKAIKQMEQFWGYISPEDQKGDPEKPQEFPSIECRIETLLYAKLGGGLPPCAEPPQELLEVVGAEVGILSNKQPFVTLSFNRVVNEMTAEEPVNYTFVPDVVISSVLVQQTDGRHVQIVADFKEKVAYTVTVSNVKSGAGAPLDKKKNTATFDGQ